MYTVVRFTMIKHIFLLEIYINAVYYHRSSEDGKLKTGKGEVVGFNLLVLRHKDKNVCLVNIYCKVNHLAIPLL